MEITEENFETYLTNSYLNTTKEKEDYFSTILFITLILLFIMLALFIFTIFDKDKLIYNFSGEIVGKIKKQKTKKQ